MGDGYGHSVYRSLMYGGSGSPHSDLGVTQPCTLIAEVFWPLMKCDLRIRSHEIDKVAWMGAGTSLDLESRLIIFSGLGCYSWLLLHRQARTAQYSVGRC